MLNNQFTWQRKEAARRSFGTLNKKNMIRPNFPFAAVGFKNLGEGLGNILFNLCKEALVNDQNHKFAAKNSQKALVVVALFKLTKLPLHFILKQNNTLNKSTGL